METNKLLKKLEEIKEELYNNVHSSEKGSPLQVNSVTEFELDEDAKGEDVKIVSTGASLSCTVYILCARV